MIDGVGFVSSSKYRSHSSLILFTTYVNNKEMQIMIDTGAQNSFVHERNLTLNDNLKFSTIPQQKFYMADGLTLFVVTGTVILNIFIGDMLTSISAYYDLEIKAKAKFILFYLHDQTITIPIDKECIPFDFINPLSQSERMRHDHQLNTIATSSSFHIPELAIGHLLHHLTDQVEYHTLQVLLYKFKSIFDHNTFTVATTQMSHVIETHPHTPPVSKYYPGNRTSNSEMYLIITKLLHSELIRESQSSYAAPALLIKIKDNTWRLVIDYKKLNAITIKDNYPLPNMELALQTLGASYHFFSKLDLKSGFWQFPINAKDRFKTAFITPFGLYEWNVLP
ncbi:unnamed protein product [Rotaria magnacalcarata]|uniref:Reverse transcriptase domain-containing protein n=2 Tax=Rotaria magnacalcarata TaxID=392030 RepID=A0A815LS14_9BILA|nr:unnamed protein product [Rotaria magnacalcarata]CAF4090708.1 unnamed protein product [Rotaria magnacalcarata]